MKVGEETGGEKNKRGAAAGSGMMDEDQMGGRERESLNQSSSTLVEIS
jgi:hypothetical protein